MKEIWTITNVCAERGGLDSREEEEEKEEEEEERVGRGGGRRGALYH